MYEQVWKDQKIPKDWVIRLVFICKTGDNKDGNNYRGITLNAVGKIMKNT